jgi:polysaccharide export outer membrane protein
MNTLYSFQMFCLAVCTALVATLAGCASPHAVPVVVARGDAVAMPFKTAEKASTAVLMSKEDLAMLEESTNPVYRIGSGDVVRVEVFGRPEVSGKHVVGPDGNITVPIVGDVALGERTRDEARALLDQQLRQFFTKPYLTFAVDEYTSNQVTVLGRVERAGMQKFPHPPTLAEVLAGAGAMPILDKQATLTRCAIMRGRDKLIWVDLKALLNGDPAYNLRMKKGDIVFIPDSSDTAVYVLGQVIKPGSYRLTPRMTLLDAVAQAGGLTDDAQPREIGLYRSGAAEIQVIQFEGLINPGRAVNFALEDGDVVFVPRSNLAELGYFMRQMAPGLSVLNFGLTLKAANK